MDDQALMLLMSSIMLLAKMMQESIVDVDSLNWTITLLTLYKHWNPSTCFSLLLCRNIKFCLV
jgi:hypothetical protein